MVRMILQTTRKKGGKAQMLMKRSLCQRKTEVGLEKRLANLWRGKKIRKRAHVGRGLESKWEIPDNMSDQPEAKSPKEPESINPDWHSYRTGANDKAGRRIDKVYAFDDDYIIYFCDCELFYETTRELQKDLGSANAALARINRLLPKTPHNKQSREYSNRLSVLELVADACEMVFCGQRIDGMEILNSIRDKLQTTEESKRRLMYQLGSVSITTVVWVIYLYMRCEDYMPGAWDPWVLAAALAMAGGVFSVCLNLGSLKVNVNQRSLFLLFAGATRSVVASLAGFGLLLAMRSKMFAAIPYEGEPPIAGTPLVVAEMFFCFLAGFSESFVPNILRDSEKKPTDPAKPDDSTKSPDSSSIPPATQSKTTH